MEQFRRLNFPEEAALINRNDFALAERGSRRETVEHRQIDKGFARQNGDNNSTESARGHGVCNRGSQDLCEVLK